uniref:Uncharacterized protein n=1 Tax=Candidatus Kentrum sp. TUN TaxID=2126343 RepID=A0A451AN80_9GAMM|nr:MAG: hypothetical protein BECKTUN1418E_GA0071001_11507 [Candidatus Kentron sp. TUN]
MTNNVLFCHPEAKDFMSLFYHALAWQRDYVEYLSLICLFPVRLYVMSQVLRTVYYAASCIKGLRSSTR